jgi:hypothetical protein
LSEWKINWKKGRIAPFFSIDGAGGYDCPVEGAKGEGISFWADRGFFLRLTSNGRLF